MYKVEEVKSTVTVWHQREEDGSSSGSYRIQRNEET